MTDLLLERRHVPCQASSAPFAWTLIVILRVDLETSGVELRKNHKHCPRITYGNNSCMAKVAYRFSSMLCDLVKQKIQLMFLGVIFIHYRIWMLLQSHSRRLRSASMISARPFSCALISTVFPSLSDNSGFAPCCSSISTISSLPSLTAVCNGVSR